MTELVTSPGELAWLKADAFLFKMHHPNYVEEDHMAVMGLRSDFRCYYAVVTLPSKYAAIQEARKALKIRFESYLEDPPTSQVFTEEEYDKLVFQWLQERNGTMLDGLPWEQS